MRNNPQERVWDRGWDAHDAQQLRRLAALPLAEKLRWLEEAQRLVRHLSAATTPPGAAKVPR